MPRRADHDQRRRQITDATRRVVARGGLAAATFQSVADEAGVSVRLVQYYFGSKREFLLATHREVIGAMTQRFTDALAEVGAGAAPRALLHALLGAQLPLDDAGRADAIVLDAFHTAALTGSPIAAEDTVGAPRLLVEMVADQLRRARGDGADGDGVASDAWLVVVAVAGLAQAMLVDGSLAARGEELLERILDRFLDAG